MLKLPIQEEHVSVRRTYLLLMKALLDLLAEMPFEQIVSKEIQERIRPDASYIVGEPDEVLCFGIARKSPKKRTHSFTCPQ